MKIELDKNYQTEKLKLFKGERFTIIGVRLESKKFFYVVEVKGDVILIDKEFCSIL